jgi:hypothetical protein
MIVVSPYRPFIAESPAHKKLGAFDWVGALSMLRTSVRRSCACETHALTDVDTDLGVPAYRYATTHRRLMLWILEVSLAYLDSADFTDDTVMISPDILIFGDLAPYFSADLGVLVRAGPKYVDKPFLNGVQWWRHAAQARLVRLYTRALAIAERLPDNAIKWGADTLPFVELLAPFVVGRSERAGVTVVGIRHTDVLQGVTGFDQLRLSRGQRVTPVKPIVDFKYLRKRHMRRYFAATIGSAVAA